MQAKPLLGQRTAVAQKRYLAVTACPATAAHVSNRCYKSRMEQLAIKLLGFAAATCTTLAYAPQFIKVWRTRSTEDISLGMFLVMLLGLVLWLLYGLFSGDVPLIIANAITIVLAGGILFMKLKYG
ncbi:uncharacterized protein with PQ loop repeat [Bradyrhizobium sp. AZCC 1578]